MKQLRRDGIDHFVPAIGVPDLKILLAVLVIPRPQKLINGSTMTTFTVQSMLIRQNPVFCRDMLYRLCKQCDHVIMLLRNPSAHSPGSHLHLIN